MAVLFENQKIGGIYAVDNPFAVPGLIRIGNFAPALTSGCLITGFQVETRPRYSLDYSVGGAVYFYYYGGSLITIVVSGMAVQHMGIGDICSYGDGLGYLQAWWTATILNYAPGGIILGAVLYGGYLTGVKLQSDNTTPGVVTFDLEFLVNFVTPIR